MASFGYVAIAANGKEKKGSMEAKDAERVRAALKAEGLIPVSVTEQGLMSKDIQIGGGKKVTPRDLGVFCRQFGSVLSAGVTVVSALEMMQEQTENKRLREAIGVVKQGVEKGQSLGDSMRMAKDVFPGILIFPCCLLIYSVFFSKFTQSHVNPRTSPWRKPVNTVTL